MNAKELLCQSPEGVSDPLAWLYVDMVGWEIHSVNDLIDRLWRVAGNMNYSGFVTRSVVEDVLGAGSVHKLWIMIKSDDSFLRSSGVKRKCDFWPKSQLQPSKFNKMVVNEDKIVRVAVNNVKKVKIQPKLDDPFEKMASKFSNMAIEGEVSLENLSSFLSRMNVSQVNSFSLFSRNLSEDKRNVFLNYENGKGAKNVNVSCNTERYEFGPSPKLCSMTKFGFKMPERVLEPIPEGVMRSEKCQVDARIKIVPLCDAKPDADGDGKGEPPVVHAHSQKLKH